MVYSLSSLLASGVAGAGPVSARVADSVAVSLGGNCCARCAGAGGRPDHAACAVVACDLKKTKHFQEGSVELQIPPRQAGTGRLRSNEQSVPGDRRGTRLAFSRRIPGLKRETWGTHRVSRWDRFGGSVKKRVRCLPRSFLSQLAAGKSLA